MIRPLAFAAAALAATPAHAHGALPGGGGFYAGLSHPFLALEHFLLLLALGLLLGRQPRGPAHAPLTALAMALGTGLALGAVGVTWSAMPFGVLIGAATAGVVLAMALQVPLVGMAALAAVAGFVVGLDTGVPAPTETAAIATYAPYAGVLVGVFLIVLNAMALSSLARRAPYTIGLRVAGSWIFAAAVMVLALQVRRLVGAA